MESKSIYKQFYIKLIVATSLFIIILSFIFYKYAENSFYSTIQENLLRQAQQIEKGYISPDKFTSVITDLRTIHLIQSNQYKDINFSSFSHNNKYYIELMYPFNVQEGIFVQITKDITLEKDIFYSIIFKNLFIIMILGSVLMVLYALVLSKSLLKPIIQINKKLANMDANSLTQIDEKDLPIEFHSLANSINSLTHRIETYLKFKKELFIGIAHELKTPLAVMKLKNEVTLKKKREIEQYEEALRLTIKEIDDMNIMISSILDIGRTEGAQFEQVTSLDLVKYIKNKTNDYKMLSDKKNIDITFFSNVNKLDTSIQITLFNQILQNFVQNAIKFTPPNRSIVIRLRKTKCEIVLSVTDEGIGIDTSIDLFAPFKKVGNQSGVGLGLYLTKIAAVALKGTISINNRDDGKSGCVAKFILHNTPKKIN